MGNGRNKAGTLKSDHFKIQKCEPVRQAMRPYRPPEPGQDGPGQPKQSPETPKAPGIETQDKQMAVRDENPRGLT